MRSAVNISIGREARYHKKNGSVSRIDDELIRVSNATERLATAFEA